MDVKELDINLNNIPQDILFLFRLKANEFRRDGALSIESKDIRDYLYNIKWKDEEMMDTCDLIDDIMSVELSEVFDYLKVKVIKEASNMNLNDFQDLISK